jgi:hypothetical protein
MKALLKFKWGYPAPLPQSDNFASWRSSRLISRIFRFAWLLLAVCLSGCAGPSYQYEYKAGKTAVLENGQATAPESAPPQVHAAITAGNRIHGLPYGYGRGHGTELDTAYDCSGAASYVLREAGLLRGATTSKAFRKYGRSGEGDWISVYARKGHVFLVVAGLRFDTGWHGQNEGPKWTTKRRPAKRYKIRHPAGL